MKDITDEKIEDIVKEKVNEMYLEIQTLIGVEDGAFAEEYHEGTGEKFESDLASFFRNYANLELELELGTCFLCRGKLTTDTVYAVEINNGKVNVCENCISDRDDIATYGNSEYYFVSYSKE